MFYYRKQANTVNVYRLQCVYFSSHIALLLIIIIEAKTLNSEQHAAHTAYAVIQRIIIIFGSTIFQKLQSFAPIGCTRE